MNTSLSYNRSYFTDLSIYYENSYVFPSYFSFKLKLKTQVSCSVFSFKLKLKTEQLHNC